MRDRIRRVLTMACLVGTLFLSLRPLADAWAERVKMRTEIIRERWALAQDAWQEGVQSVVQIGLLLVGLGGSAGGLAVLWRGVLAPVWIWYCSRPRWVKANLRLIVKPKRERETRAGSVEI